MYDRVHPEIVRSQTNGKTLPSRAVTGGKALPRILLQKETLVPTVLVVAATKPRTRLVNILRETGYAVAEADSEETAFEIARAASPALILITILMPNGNGLEVAARLRQHLDSKLPPIILLGTITPIGIDEEPLASLVSGYLNMDVSSDELLAVVRSHVGNPPTR